MTKRGIFFTVLGAIVVTLLIAYLTLTQPGAILQDYGLGEPERTADNGPKNTYIPVDGPGPSSAAPTTGGHGGFEDPREKDNCVLSEDELYCLPQLPELSVGAPPAPQTSPPVRTTPPVNCE